MVWLVTDGGGQTSKHKWRDTVNYIMCHANHAIRGYYDNMHTTVDTVSQELSRFCQCLFLLNVIEISNQPTIWALDLRRENSQWWWTVVDNSTMCTLGLYKWRCPSFASRFRSRIISRTWNMSWKCIYLSNF